MAIVRGHVQCPPPSFFVPGENEHEKDMDMHVDMDMDWEGEGEKKRGGQESFWIDEPIGKCPDRPSIMAVHGIGARVCLIYPSIIYLVSELYDPPIHLYIFCILVSI